MDEMITLGRRRLRENADPEKAVPMQAYMKTDMPFYGVQKPTRTTIVREIRRTLGPTLTLRDHHRLVLGFWGLPHREEKYIAIALALAWPALIRRSCLPLYRRLIVEGAWWDFVDDIAIRLVGRVLQDDREKTNPTLDGWIDHDDMWLRRTAIIAQIKHKDATDEARLFDYCLARSHESEFFIRKAIGWALREHAKTRPAAVTRFIKRHRDRLSTLSVREGAKHLDID